MPAPDLSVMTLPELRAWDVALRHAVAALSEAGEGDVAIYADAEGVSVTITVPIGRCEKERS